MKKKEIKNKKKMIQIKNIPVKLPPFKVEKVISILSETAQWGITKLNVPDTWKVTQGEGITVLIIDTGCTDHIDLAGAILKDKCKNYVESDIYDNNGHSTHCCGIVGARQNDMGCVGVAPKCNIITIKVLGRDGTGTVDGIVEALQYALTIKPDIISMSLGAPEGTSAFQEAIKALYEANIPVIAAAGNEGGADTKTDTVNYPAKYPETIAVAAMDENGKIADYSSYGSEVDITAPGSNIYSTWLNNKYAKLSGTSMATPFVAGVVALLLAKHRKQQADGLINDCQTVEDIRQHLIKYADPETGQVGEIGQRDDSYGYGIINPDKLIFEVSENPQPLPKPPKKSLLRKIKDWFLGLFGRS